jgi:phage terminase large subunit
MAGLEQIENRPAQTAERWEDLDIPGKLDFLREPNRYKVAYGGRGGMKTWSFARALLWNAFLHKERILCAREYQSSILESVHKVLCDQIDLLGMDGFFRITDRNIMGQNGSEFIFAGLRNDPRKIKSMEGVTKCWVAEAEKMSNPSWQILIPTIRNPGSEIWVEFNPDLLTDPTMQRFVVNPPPGAWVQKIGWEDNPFLPEELRQEKDYLASVDLEAFAHVWAGECRTHAAAAIFKGKCVVQWFEPQPGWNGPYFGSDFGFANDPTTLHKYWIGIDNGSRNLYVEKEVYKVGLEIDDTPGEFDTIEGSRRHVIRADNARPETISYLRRQGFNIVGAGKGRGSVEDGITFLKSFAQIVIHPDCPHMAEEAKLYSYKVDRLSGDILPVVVDAHNHCWDDARYALEPIMKAGIVRELDLS